MNHTGSEIDVDSDSKFQILKEQVQNLISNLQPDAVASVFVKYALPRREQEGKEEVFVISRENFVLAMQEIRCGAFSKEELVELFSNMDVDDNHYLDQSEFARAVEASSPAELFLQSLNVPRLFAAALPQKPGQDAMETMRLLSRPEIDAIVRATAGAISDELERKVAVLKAGSNSKENKEGSEDKNSAALKFAVDEMQAGNIDDYHKGLVQRVGKLPHIRDTETFRAH